MSIIREAFRRGRNSVGPGEPGERGGDLFAKGAAWVREILVPTVTRANLELEGERVVVRLDLNLAQESTNHPHADFWLAEVGQEHNRCGARYSLNVIAGRDVWLYKPGAPGVALGSIGQCGPEQIERLLAQATEEFAQSMGARA